MTRAEVYFLNLSTLGIVCWQAALWTPPHAWWMCVLILATGFVAGAGVVDTHMTSIVKTLPFWVECIPAGVLLCGALIGSQGLFPWGETIVVLSLFGLALGGFMRFKNLYFYPLGN